MEKSGINTPTSCFIKHVGFTLAEVLIPKRMREKMSLLNLFRVSEIKAPSSRFIKHCAFTLAEVLIVISILGILASMTVPTLVENIGERTRKEQARTAKYKLTQATDSMKSLDLIGPYPTTKDFINELKKHFKIAKICENNNLVACWPTATIETADKKIDVSILKTGKNIKAIAPETKDTETMGIVTADGVPMILVYSPVCTPMDPYKTYTWSMVDFKPETNATTSCISAIFDINGSKGPNKVNEDVITFNSSGIGTGVLYKILGAKSLSYTQCEAERKDKLKGKITACCDSAACKSYGDYWAGAVKACDDEGMRLATAQELANIAGSKFGRTDVTEHTYISNATIDLDSPYATLTGDFWSGSETSDVEALYRSFNHTTSNGSNAARWGPTPPLCVGD